ncbi:HD domain-containing protein [Microbulbifer sp. JTAC008]|uniref:HD domain-containing protein n=1 Tax=unclassified Microbulbifer TaxID=2619833 RepID=UPI004039609E
MSDKVNMRNKARSFAIQAHGDQRYGSFPYSVHLDEVAKIASEYGEEAEVVAYLHDVIEDTDVTAKEIEDIFGELVSRCVCILSDEPGETRKIRKSATYQKMAKVSGSEELALLVKAADRLANMRACLRSGDKAFLNMYRGEYEVFRRSAYRPNLCDKIWSEIEEIQNLYHSK